MKADEWMSMTTLIESASFRHTTTKKNKKAFSHFRINPILLLFYLIVLFCSLSTSSVRGFRRKFAHSIFAHAFDLWAQKISRRWSGLLLLFQCKTLGFQKCWQCWKTAFPRKVMLEENLKLFILKLVVNESFRVVASKRSCKNIAGSLPTKSYST